MVTIRVITVKGDGLNVLPMNPLSQIYIKLFIKKERSIQGLGFL
jgi:hypothetical protein